MNAVKITLLCCTSLLVIITNGQQISFKQKIVPFDTAQWGRNFFGSDVMIHDGTLLIGDSGNDLNGSGAVKIDNTGAIGFYEMNNGTWSFNQKLIANKRSTGGAFGHKFEISDSSLFVSSPDAHEFGASNFIIKAEVGSVEYFSKDLQGNWSYEQTIMASDRQQFDGFGTGLAVSGNELFIGASGQDYDSLGNNFRFNAGAVYYFKKNANGIWEEQQKITSPDRAIQDESFGAQAILYDGNQLFIGSTSDADSNGNNLLSRAGALFVYEKNNQHQWVNVQKITPSQRDTVDVFGVFSNALLDNYLFAVSRNGTDENGANYLRGAGACYIFKRNASNRWKEIQKLVSPHRKTANSWGSHESIFAYKDYLLIGAYRDWTNENDLDSLTQAGSVFLFKRNENDKYEFIRKLVAEPRIFGQEFGYSVFMDSAHIIVSSIDERYGMLQRGAVNYFSFIDTSGSGGGGGTTGIESHVSNTIKVFPNPSNGQFRILLNQEVTNASLTIIDFKGVVVMQKRISGKVIHISESLPSGIYMIQLENPSGFMRQKLIINSSQ